ncbi:hypothetical protein LJR016_005179 [Devosia sp. LjRoot16]|uniref:hypothetical protein n=1 Tax=Devosia sp. LjRoot16 TaxID=3342271 RepID=UPI003ECE5D85
MSKFPHKPPAPSVRFTLGGALAWAKAQSETQPPSQQQVAMELIAKLDLPEPLKVRLRELHSIEDN